MLNQSGILPSAILVRFPGRRCGGNVSDVVPTYYVKRILATDVGLTFTGYPATKTYHEYCLALFDTVAATPTNQTALDTLARRIAIDSYTWWQVTFDRTYNGILNLDITGYYDEVIIDYNNELPTTRIHSYILNLSPEELMHHDPANANCTDANNMGKPVAVTPCCLVYGPPSACVSGKLTLTVYKQCIIDGILTQTYVRTDTVT